MSEIKVVPVSEEHIVSFHLCLDVVSRERKYLAMLEGPPLSSIENFIRTNIENDNPQFVAVKDNEVIGWCDIIPKKMEGFRHCGQLGMGIRSGYRGKGLGEKLASLTISKAKEKGLERVQLEVYASNEPAVGLYKKLGFEVEGIKKRGRKLDGIYDDIIEMALFL